LETPEGLSFSGELVTDHEQACVLSLAKLRVRPAAAEVFIRQLYRWIDEDPDRSLSEKQRAWLFGLGWKYRTSLPNYLWPICRGGKVYPED
jgi:hypothetical protein